MLALGLLLNILLIFYTMSVNKSLADRTDMTSHHKWVLHETMTIAAVVGVPLLFASPV